jgi:hypothetical protein
VSNKYRTLIRVFKPPYTHPRFRSLCKKGRQTHVSRLVYYAGPKVFAAPVVVLESVAHAFLDGLLRTVSARVSQDLRVQPTSLTYALSFFRFDINCMRTSNGSMVPNTEVLRYRQVQRRSRKHDVTALGLMRYLATQRYWWSHFESPLRSLMCRIMARSQRRDMRIKSVLICYIELAYSGPASSHRAIPDGQMDEQTGEQVLPVLFVVERKVSVAYNNNIKTSNVRWPISPHQAPWSLSTHNTSRSSCPCPHHHL